MMQYLFIEELISPSPNTTKINTSRSMNVFIFVNQIYLTYLNCSINQSLKPTVSKGNPV